MGDGLLEGVWEREQKWEYCRWISRKGGNTCRWISRVTLKINVHTIWAVDSPRKICSAVPLNSYALKSRQFY